MRGLLHLLCLLGVLATTVPASSSSTLTPRRHQPAKRDYARSSYFVLELSNPSLSPYQAAQALELDVVEQVGELQGHWLVSTSQGNNRHPTVLDQFDRLRRKRAPHLSGVLRLDPQIPRQRVKRVFTPELSLQPRQRQSKVSDYIQALVKKFAIQDPIFKEQWHLANDRMRDNDVNVTGVWEQDISGVGTTVAVIDDGLDMHSDDLADNFFAEGSWDFNDHTALPEPRLSDDLHGTRCAGEIAAVKNQACGMGIAYNAQVSGIRILSAAISDADEAAALNFGYQHNDIYSCSWGPPDDGRSCEAPSRLITKSILNGVQNGRDGKGSIFVFASGNGGAVDDQCNFDGYTNSIYSVTVGAIDREGLHPYYSEACSAVMVVTYSSGSGDNIHTTDVGKHKCTARHGGTSAAAPIAAGVLALVLSVRPELTWRDVQHLCINTAVPVNLNDRDWTTTHAGRPYNHKFGYGKLDSWAIVEAAKTWQLVKPQAWWESHVLYVPEDQQKLSAKGVSSSVDVSTELLLENNVERLEHITVRVDIQNERRGNIEVQLISPNGIISSLARPRRFDNDASGLEGWTFMTVKHWGENPIGTWTLKVLDKQKNGKSGAFKGWSVTMWGESRDASLATLYKLPHDDHLHLPPQPTAAKGGAAPGAEQTTPSEKEMQEEQAYENEIFPSPEPKPHIGDQGDDDDQQKWTTATTTKRRRPKPTEHLPSDHDVRPGHSDLALDPTIPSDVPQLDAEQDEPASSNQVSSSTPSSAKATSSYFSSMTSLMKDSTWIYIAAPLAALFGASLLGFFWWRRRRATGNGRGRYGFEPVAGGEDEGVPMTESRTATSSTTGARTTRDLYDAFGVGSDDEDSDDDHQQQYKSHTSFRDVEAASPATRSAEELFNRDSDGR